MTPNDRGATPARPGWPEIIVALVAYLLLIAALAVVLFRIPDEDAVLRGTLGMAANGVAGMLALTGALLLRIRSPAAFGFRSVAVKWLFAGVALGLLAYGVSHVIEGVYFHFVAEVNTQADFQAAATDGLASLIVLLVAGALLTPLGEEAVFRGVVANALNRYGAWAGIVGSAAIFAAVHGPSVIFFNALLVGIVTGALFRRTGSIWPCLAAHTVFNASWLVTYALA